MTLIFKICSRPLWQDAEKKGVFDGAPIDVQDGYIHFSTQSQVQETAAKHFAGQDNLLLIAVEGDDLALIDEVLGSAPAKDGTRFVRVSIRRGTPDGLPRPTITPPDVKTRLMRHIGTAQGVR